MTWKYWRTQDDWIVSSWKLYPKSSVNVLDLTNGKTTVQSGLRQAYECIAFAPISPWLTAKKESGSPLQTDLVCNSNPLMVSRLPKTGCACMLLLAVTMDLLLFCDAAGSFVLAVFIYICCLLCFCCYSILLLREDLSRNLELTESKPMVSAGSSSSVPADYVPAGHILTESKEEVQEESKEEESKRKRKLGTRKKMKPRKRRFIQNTSEDDKCLGTKPQDDKVEHLEEINQNVVIRSNGQKRYFSTLMRVLSIFDREDLNVVFNPDDEDKFWNSQQDWNIVSWKLHGSSGVHTLVTEAGLVIHMLVEKKYPLRKKVLKIHKERKKSYYQIIKADGSSKMYLVFSHMLKSFDREDLETLYKLVKAKYGSTRPVEDLDLVLYGDLKTMFEPHVEDNGRIVGIKRLLDDLEVTAAQVCVTAAKLNTAEDMDLESALMVAASKVPMLKPENENTAPKTTIVEGVEKVIHPTTAEEKAQKRLEVKAKSTLMMGIPNEHQFKFNSIKGAKLLLEAIEKSSETLDQTFDRLQKLVSQLEILGETLSQEDVNQKLLRSLSPKWNTHVVVWRNKLELETISMDDLYNNLKVYEPKVKGT
ncbi:hypothetical protein Tco_0964772 [Tanacetum coccineum]